MSSNLTGQFIANTFQNLLQIDSGNTPNSTTILNGLGQVKQRVTVDSNSDPDGGLFIKDGQGTGRIMGIQYVNSNNGEGLNFWTPNSINANLFLKRTGTTWVGYNSGGSVVVDSDVATYSLYVKDGVQVGQNTTGNNGRINLIGSNPLENGSGMFINGEHPFKLFRYVKNFTSQITSVFNLSIIDENSNLIRVDEYLAILEKGNILGSTGLTTNAGNWAINWSGGVFSTNTLIFEVLLIKKGMYFDEDITLP
jgi:hypothetical protein